MGTVRNFYFSIVLTLSGCCSFVAAESQTDVLFIDDLNNNNFDYYDSLIHVSAPESIEIINCNTSRLFSINDAIFLKSLSIAHIEKQELPFNVKVLNSLTSLALSFANEKVKFDFSPFISLRKLQISGNELEAINFSECVKIRHLIIDIPGTIVDLNSMYIIPDSCEYVQIMGKKVVWKTVKYRQLNLLTELYIFAYDGVFLSIKNLKASKLQTIDLKYVQCNNMNFLKFKDLKTVTILGDFPFDINVFKGFNKSKIESLNYSMNDAKMIPKFLSRAEHLKNLIIQGLSIQCENEEEFFKKNKQLKKLKIYKKDDSELSYQR